MKNTFIAIFALYILLCCANCARRPISSVVTPESLRSPNGDLQIYFLLSPKGQPAYLAKYRNSTIIDTSYLGFALKKHPSLQYNFEMADASLVQKNEYWKPVWGTDSLIHQHYNQVKVLLTEKTAPHRSLHLIFRAYNDGFAFRYELPDIGYAADDTLVIADELTQFNLPTDNLCWWYPADYDSDEHLYTTSLISQINPAPYVAKYKNLAFNAVQEQPSTNTPLTMRTPEGIYISIHEAALRDFPSMTLSVDTAQHRLSAALVPAADGTKAAISLPFSTPWRMIQISDTPEKLVESHLLLNLNEPCQLNNTEWIKPQKYMGIWWAMHIGKATWVPSPTHAANTENAKKHIDFAAQHHIDALLIEGWNTGWENWNDTDRVQCFDFITPYSDFDLPNIVQYGKQKGVSLISHHETASAVPQYEKQLEKAFAQCQKLGISTVKTGYVGKIMPKGEFHHGQKMIQHYQKVTETAAKYQIMLDVHEPIKPTGLCRTFPNLMSGEGVRGMEYNAWSEGNLPEHTTILPFTRGLAGAIDYTPGIFNIRLDNGHEIHSTLANQLALYVVLYSPLQMAADLPENYLSHLDAFQFIEQVPTDWAVSKCLKAQIGDYVATARREKGSQRWFVGAITDENARSLELKLDFLPPQQNYIAEIYADASNAHWHDNPQAYTITTKIVNSQTILPLQLASGGGCAIILRPQ